MCGRAEYLTQALTDPAPWFGVRCARAGKMTRRGSPSAVVGTWLIPCPRAPSFKALQELFPGKQRERLGAAFVRN